MGRHCDGMTLKMGQGGISDKRLKGKDGTWS